MLMTDARQQAGPASGSPQSPINTSAGIQLVPGLGIALGCPVEPEVNRVSRREAGADQRAVDGASAAVDRGRCNQGTAPPPGSGYRSAPHRTRH